MASATRRWRNLQRGGSSPAYATSRMRSWVKSKRSPTPCNTRRRTSSSARGPRQLTEPRHRGLAAARPRERPHQCDRVRLGQRTERELHEELFTSKLVDGVAKRGRIGQLLLAGGDDNEHRPGLDPPAEEGKQAQAHLISPVDVLQDQKCRPETG